MIVARATNVLVQKAGLRRFLGLLLPSRLAVLLILQDRSDRTVGTGAEYQSLGTGGVQPVHTVTFVQSKDADARTEPLFGMWT